MANPNGASDAEIGTFIDTVYGNLFNRSSDAAGLAYWTAQTRQALDAGRDAGAVLLDIISGTNAGADVRALIGKVAVGLEFVRQQELHLTQWQDATDKAAAAASLQGITSDPQSVLLGIKEADQYIALHA